MTKKSRLLAVLLAMGLLWILTPRGAEAVGQEGAGLAGEKQAKDAFGDPLPEGAKARMGTVRWRHPAPITFLGFANKQKHVVTACSDGFFRVWDAASGKEVRRFGGPVGGGGNGGVMVQPGGGVMIAWPGPFGSGSVALSPGGEVLASSEGNGKIALWDVATGKKLRAVGADPNKNGPVGFIAFPAGMESLSFSPDGHMLAVKGGDGTIGLWGVGDGKAIRTLGKKPDGNQNVVFGGNGGALTFLPGGKAIVTSGFELDGMNAASLVRLLDAQNGKEIWRLKTEDNNFSPGSFTVTPNGKSIVRSGPDGLIHFHDIENGKEARTIGKEQQGVPNQSLVISPNGKILATQTIGNPAIVLWDVETGKELRKIEGQASTGNQGLVINFGMGGPTTIAFSADSKTLAEATSGNTVRQWNVDTGKEIATVSGHSGGVSQIAVSPDGKTLTTSAPDRTIRQWKMTTGEEIRQVKLPVESGEVALSADGKRAAWTNADKLILWDVEAGKESRIIDLPGQQQQIQFAGMTSTPLLSRDGKHVAVRTFDQNIYVFDTGTGKEFRRLEQPRANGGGGFGIAIGGVAFRTPMAFSPDGTALATAGGSTGFDGPNGIFAPGMGGGSALHWWRVATGARPRRFDTPERGIAALAVSPDGRHVVTANSDNTLSVLEVLTGKECLHIKLAKEDKKDKKPVQQGNAFVGMGFGPMMMATFTAMAISPDGRTLALGHDKTIRLWDLRTGKELGQFKSHDGAILSVTFAPDNQTVISGSADTTALVWDGGRFIKKDVPIAELKPGQMEDLWKDLAADPVKAYQAIVVLGGTPKQALALFEEQLKPAPGSDRQQIDQWIVELDSAKFAVRNKATEELRKIGELAQPALQEALKKQPSLEAQARLEKLLDQISGEETPLPNVQRLLRAVQILEGLADPNARAVLQRLADGAPGARLTRHAEEALKRLGQ